ncbi:MAG TPA: hypothetical protein DCW97_02165, partial [Acidobacteria bacterium]|nr:hypothetical protein [Acidobacteriota bacterium]
MTARSKIIAYPVLFFLVLFLIGRVSIAVDPWEQGLNKIILLSSMVKQNYYENKDDQKLTFAAIRGMLDTLDPHSYFLDPESSLRFNEDYTGKYYG